MSVVEIVVERDQQWPSWWWLTVDGGEPQRVRLRQLREVVAAAETAGHETRVVWPAPLAALLERVSTATEALAEARRASEQSRLDVVAYLIGEGADPLEKNADIGAALGVSSQRAGALARTLREQRRPRPRSSGPSEQ